MYRPNPMAMLAGLLNPVIKTIKLTSGFIVPNKKKKNKRNRRPQRSKPSNKLGMRGYDGTMYSTYRSRPSGRI